ncbi:MAG: hypothetical protein IJ583_02930 [Firmicutes bacterium]|nr:hypothetical protein [Bacillota bacterium]
MADESINENTDDEIKDGENTNETDPEDTAESINDDDMEKVMFKKMSGKEKLDHILEYYKLHIAGVVVMIIFAASLIYHYVIAPNPEVYAGVGFYHTFLSDNKIVLINDTLTENLTDKEKNEAVSVYTFYEIEGNVMAGVESDQRFQMLYMSEDLDVLIGEEEAFKTMAYSGYVGELENFLSDDEIKKYESQGKILECDNEISEGKKYAYAVRVDNSKIIGLVPDIKDNTLYMGFARNSIRKDNAKKVFYEIMK